ncbi:MAG: 23S rRNA (guanosine(2251)-2'-O)-methyltransferase RlmB [Chloroflexi bacterium]|nr:23S rRNA (guanosine(2251)-2'-O)-methyltransferase RlmB [Chloroflexota bacterium]
MEEQIEGRNPVLEAIKAKRPIHKIFVSHDFDRRGPLGQVVGLAKEAGIPVEYTDQRALSRLSQTGRSQGVIAVAAAKATVELDDLFRISKEKGERPFYVLLDGIEDPQNLGAIIRTAHAAGVHGVIIPTRRAAGLTAAVSRASAGALEYMQVARVTNIAQAMERLNKEGVWTVGVDPTGPKSYAEADYRQGVSLIIGAEGRGLSHLVREKCEVLVSIPMRGEVASLNASVAGALVMYEAMRQRAKATA